MSKSHTGIVVEETLRLPLKYPVCVGIGKKNYILFKKITHRT